MGKCNQLTPLPFKGLRTEAVCTCVYVVLTQEMIVFYIVIGDCCCRRKRVLRLLVHCWSSRKKLSTCQQASLVSMVTCFEGWYQLNIFQQLKMLPKINY